jgi:hypothetical protein
MRTQRLPEKLERSTVIQSNTGWLFNAVRQKRPDPMSGEPLYRLRTLSKPRVTAGPAFTVAEMREVGMREVVRAQA